MVGASVRRAIRAVGRNGATTGKLILPLTQVGGAIPNRSVVFERRGVGLWTVGVTLRKIRPPLKYGAGLYSSNRQEVIAKLRLRHVSQETSSPSLIRRLPSGRPTNSEGSSKFLSGRNIKQPPFALQLFRCSGRRRLLGRPFPVRLPALASRLRGCFAQSRGYAPCSSRQGGQIPQGSGHALFDIRKGSCQCVRVF